VLLIFGAAKLPALAKSVGQSAKILKTELKSNDSDDKTPTVVDVEPSAQTHAAASGTSTKL
jgi:sec-independent protein translocase protein TatA